MIRSILLFGFLLGFWPFAFGEGSRELEQSGGTTKVIVGVMGAFDAPEFRRIHIRIGNDPNERIYYGFGNVTQGTSGNGGAIPLYFRIKNPQGQIIEGPSLVPTSGIGFIQNRNEALAGPRQFIGNSNGYQALVFSPNGPGDYSIEFSRNPSQPSGLATLEFLDISVGNVSGSLKIPGRLWCRQWELNCLSFANLSYSQFYTYTNDSTVTRISLNGMQPLGFSLSCNSTGVSKTNSLLQDRKSVSGNSTYPEYRLFLNDPDSLEFPTGRRLSPDDFSYDIFGCLNTGYCIRINSNRNASAQVILDIDGIIGFQPNGRDRILEQKVNSGTNCILWDGKDGLGLLLNLNTTIRAKLSLRSGLTHLPIFDAENNALGYDITLVRPSGLRPLLFWDDSQIQGGTISWNGCQNPCRSWNQIYGDNRTLNTWWFSESSEQNISFTVVENCPIIAKNDTNSIVFGDSLRVKVWANDLDNNQNIDTLSTQILQGPKFGTALIENGSIRYKAFNSIGFSCRDSVKYRVSDKGPIPNDLNGKFSDSATAYFWINPPIPLVVDTFQTFCIDNPNKTLKAQTTDGRFNLVWYNSLVGVNALPQTPLTGINQAVMGNVFVAQSFSGANCVSKRVKIGFQVLNKPNPSFTGPDSVLCLGAGPFLINPVDPNATIFIDGQPNRVFNANRLGLIEVKCIVKRGACTDSSVKQYRVLDKPNTQFNMPLERCNNEGPISLIPPSFGGVFTGNGVQGNTVVFTNSGRYRIVFKNTNGLCVDSTVNTITVFEKPNATFTVSDTLICENAGPITLFPLNPNGVFSGSTFVNLNRFTPTVPGEFTIKHKVVNGVCVDSSTQKIKVVSRTLPRILGLPNRWCQLGGPIRLNGSPSNGSFSGPGVNGNNFNPTNSGRFEIKFKATTNGCTDSVSQIIEVVEQEKAVFSISDSSFCVGDPNISLNTTTMGGVFSGAGVSGNSFSPVVIGRVGIKYKINFLGCLDSLVKFVNVYPRPFIPTLLGQGDSILALSGGAVSMRWFRNGQLLADTNRKIKGSAGDYKAVAVGTNCQSDTSVTLSFIPTGIKSLMKGVRIFPNPTYDVIHITDPYLIGSWEIFNSSGQKLMLPTELNDDQYEVNLKGLPNGLYYLCSKGQIYLPLVKR